MSDLTILTKLQTLPLDLKEEVNAFIDLLLEKSVRDQKNVVPKFGSAKGKIKMSNDFDEPLDDFKEYM